MTSDEFLSEVLSSNICPDDFRNTYLSFKKYQKIVWDTLLEFDRVCRKHNIEYQLAFGTLLGAIRDGGQIPWDYDADVFIHYEDRLQFITALENDLKDEYYFSCAESNPIGNSFFIRIAPKGMNSDFIHLDVFYYVGLPGNEKECNLFIQETRSLIRRFNVKTVQNTGTLKHKIGVIYNKSKILLPTLNRIIIKINSNLSKYDSRVANRVCSANSNLGKWFYTQEMVHATVDYNVNGVLLKIPKNYVDILVQEFKDYHKVPSLESRIEEVVRANQHFSLLRR